MINVALPKKTIEFTVLDNEYTAKYPTNAGIWRMEELKLIFNEKYYELVKATTIVGQRVRHEIDMAVFFIVCCPKLMKDLKVEGFSELDAWTTKCILEDTYLPIILPWLTEWEQILNKAKDEVKDESKDQE